MLFNVPISEILSMKHLFVICGYHNSGKNTFGRLFKEYRPVINVSYLKLRLSSVKNMLHKSVYSNIRKNTHLLVFSKMLKNENRINISEKCASVYENLPNYIFLTDEHYDSIKCIFIKNAQPIDAIDITNFDTYEYTYIWIHRNKFVSLFTSFFDESEYNVEEIEKQVIKYKEDCLIEEPKIAHYKITYFEEFENFILNYKEVVKKYTDILDIDNKNISLDLAHNKYITRHEYKKIISSDINNIIVYNNIKKYFKKHISEEYYIPDLEDILSV